MLADIDATGWTVIIAAVALALNQLTAMVLSHIRSVAAERKLQSVAEKVDEIHVTTNGMSERLGATKLAQGIAEGKATGLEQGRSEKKDGG